MMNVAEEYRKIYSTQICEELKREIAIYSEEKGLNSYQPLSHNCLQKCACRCNHECHKSLGRLMRKNIIFYCYGEDEVVTNFNDGLFADLEKATKAAYRLRLFNHYFRMPIKWQSEQYFGKMIITKSKDMI